MSAQTFKEALTVLESLPDDFTTTAIKNTIRKALELAFHEAVAWESIEAWRKLYPSRECWLLLARFGFYRTSLQDVRTTPSDYRGSHHVEGPSRIKALEAAAKWCRVEMAK